MEPWLCEIHARVNHAPAERPRGWRRWEEGKIPLQKDVGRLFRRKWPGVNPLDPRIIDVRRMMGLVFTGVLSVNLFIILGILGFSVRPGWRLMIVVAGAWLALTAGLAGWLWQWPVIAYRHASYKLDDEGLEIRRGVVWRRIINVPRSRVQHTDVSQGPLERSHGLSTLVVHTAGTEHARVGLPGLSRETALSLRDQLLPHDGRDAV